MQKFEKLFFFLSLEEYVNFLTCFKVVIAIREERSCIDFVNYAFSE